MLNSDQFRAQFSPEERGTLTNLMTVEPLLPPAHPAGAAGVPPQE
jgi:hypothetical protein